MLIVSRADVEGILEQRGAAVRQALVDQLAQGYADMAAGQVLQHPRIYLRLTEEHLRRPHGLFSMSAVLAGRQRMGTRLLALGGGGGDGLLVLYDMQTKKCLSIVDDSIVHNYRTGAPAALATQYLAKQQSQVVGVIGSSGISRGTLCMVCQVRPSIQLVKVFSPTPEHRDRFASEMSDVVGRTVKAVASPKAATGDADIIITATDADSPVVPDSAVRDGTHVNAMARNEVEQSTFKRSRIIVGSHEAQRQLDPPWRFPLPPEAIAGELTDLVTGQVEGRRSSTETTVFVGSGPLAMWDVVAAGVFYEAAESLGLGTRVQLR